MKTKTLNIALPKDLIDKTDKAAKKEYRNRSEVIREALRSYLEETVAKTVSMFLPRKSAIFDGLVKQSLILKEAADILQETTNNWKKLKTNFNKLHELEHEADTVVHQITNDIEKMFIVPIDKEDIKHLAESLDDVMDNIEQAANRLYIYNLPKPDSDIKLFTLLISQTVHIVHQGIILLRKNKLSSREFSDCYKKLHELETEGDKLHRKVLKRMMGNDIKNNSTTVLSIIKWQEIFQTLEDTLDTCEDIAIIFDRIRIKYR